MKPLDGVARGAAFLLFPLFILSVSGPAVAFPVSSEPCIEDGGAALCSAPVIGARGYHLCDEYPPYMTRIALACRTFYDGTWVTGISPGPTCRDQTNPIENEDELAPRAEEFARLANGHGDCGSTHQTWSDWLSPGEHLESSLCWSGEPEYVNGVNVYNLGRFEISGIGYDRRSETCSRPWSERIVARMERPVSCPAGYRQRRVDGEVECYRLPEPCDSDVPAQVGNPVLVTSGSKLLDQQDYAGSGPGALRVDRHYRSFGFFLPIGRELEAPRGFGRLWRFNYDRRLWLMPDSPRVMAVLQTHRGEVLQFDHDGRQLHGRGDEVRLRHVTHPELGSAWRHDTSGGEREYYDGEGRLRFLVLASSGIIHTLDYDASGRLEEVRDPFGRSLRFLYEGGPLIRAMVDSADQYYRYEYDDAGNLISVQYPDETTTRYLYDEPDLILGARGRGLLTGVVDGGGVRSASYQYDGAGRVVLSEGADGAGRTELTYSSRRTGPRWVRDASGTELRYERTLVNGQWRIRSITRTCPDCAFGEVRHFEYDARGRLVAQTGWDGVRTEYTRDHRGRISERREAAGRAEERLTTTRWHSDLPLPAGRVSGALATDYAYEPMGRLVSRRETDLDTGESREWTYAYTADGLLLSTSEPAPDGAVATLRTYDPAGNLSSVQNALGHIHHYQDHDAHGNPRRIIDPNGVATVLEYDVRQRLIRRTEGTRTTRFSYDASGNLQRITLPDGTYLEHQYDAANRLVGVTDSLGNHHRYTLDAAGNRLSEALIDPQGNLVALRRQTFDSLNRLRQSLGAHDQVTAFSYDLGDNLVASIDPLQRETRHAHDALNRLIETVNPAGGRTVLGYDSADRMTRLVDPRGVTTTYGYNAFGDLLEEVSPDGGTRTFTYDAAGNRLTETDARGITRTFSHDALNRLTAIRYPDPAEDVRFIYDQGAYGIGRLSVIEDASGRTAYTYNAHGDVIAEVREHDGLRFETRYDYDLHGRLGAVRYPGGATLRFTHDTGGRVSRLSLESNPGTFILGEDLAYSAMGAVTGLRLGNGIRVEYDYDPDQRLQAARALPVQELDLVYDAAGNITALSDFLDATRSQAFDYDELDRLVSALGAYGYRDYEYDAVGNRLLRESDEGEEHYAYAADSNRLLSLSGGPAPRQYAYDANGNTLDDGRFQYSYNQANRLARVHRSGGEVARYTHNALGQRTRKTLPGGADPDEERAQAERKLAHHEAKLERLEALAGAHEFAVGQAEDQAETLLGEAAAARREAGRLAHRASTQARLADSLKARADQLNEPAAARLRAQAERARADALGLEASAEEALARADAAEQQADALMAEADDLRELAEAAREEARHHEQQAVYWRERLAGLDSGVVTPVEQHRYFVHDVNGQLIGEYGHDGRTVREYIYLQGMPLAMLHGDEVYFYHTDHLGTPRRMTDIDQRVVWDAVQSPFGTLTLKVEEIENPLRFPGQYFDEETGLHYNWYRYYDQRSGRYITSDPIGIAGGLNSYGYALGNPLRWYDSNGLQPTCNGWWQYAGFNPQIPRVLRLCTCYWLCRDCDYPVAWSGIKESLPATTGQLYFDPTVRGPEAGDIEAGNACLCYNKPGPETGCDDGGCDQ
jgi:RHS repeat-associated protein